MANLNYKKNNKNLFLVLEKYCANNKLRSFTLSENNTGNLPQICKINFSPKNQLTPLPGSMLIAHQAKNGVTIASTWSFVNGSSKDSEAASAEIGFPPIFVIATPAWVTASSPS